MREIPDDVCLLKKKNDYTWEAPLGIFLRGDGRNPFFYYYRENNV